MLTSPIPAAGSVKGLTTAQLVELDCHVILGNTYHLENRPGSELVAEMGGLHGFINWQRWAGRAGLGRQGGAGAGRRDAVREVGEVGREGRGWGWWEMG